MSGIGDNDEFYFAHSYYMEVYDKNLILSKTEYDFQFVSAIENNNIFGVQYHPEKSHDAGDIFLSNYIKL